MSTCPFLLKTGKNKGEKCGSKVYQNNDFCKRHLPKSETLQEIVENETLTENTHTNESNETKKIKDEKPIKSKEKKEKKGKESKDTEKEKPKKKEKPVIKDEPSINHKIYETFKLSAKRNQYGNYVLENDLVVEPGPDRIILGRQFEDKIIDISIEDIEFCKIHGLMYKEPINMYFRNTENEKIETKLQKELLKEIKKKDEKDETDIVEDEADEDNSDAENDDEEL